MHSRLQPVVLSQKTNRSGGATLGKGDEMACMTGAPYSRPEHPESIAMPCPAGCGNRVSCTPGVRFLSPLPTSEKGDAPPFPRPRPPHGCTPPQARAAAEYDPGRVVLERISN